MLPHFVLTFDHELVSTMLISFLLAAAAWPFKKIIKTYNEAKTKWDDIHTELVKQRTNCLDTLQVQGDSQIKLLGKACDVLGEMRDDSKLMLEHLRDKK
jgi:hypothetical protein